MPLPLIEEKQQVTNASPGQVVRDARRVRSTIRASRPDSYFYLLSLAIPSIFLLTIGLFIAPSQWLADRMQDPFLDDVGYGATLHHVDCEVVIYGDSSAEVGVDAPALQERTGLTSCNLAEPASMTTLNGTTVLDRYLAQNKPPRIIVFFFAPEHLTPHTPDISVGAFEAVTYRMREPDKLRTLANMWREPFLIFTWVSFADQDAAHILVARAMARLHLRSPLPTYDRHSRLERQGSLTLPGFVTGDCQTMPEPQLPDPSWVSALRKRYSGPNTTVLVDAMAIPDCDPGLMWDRSHIQPIVDNGVTTLPISVYFPLTRHVNADGSKVLTDRLAAQIIAARGLAAGPKAY